MTGSGNDFVFVDGRLSPPEAWTPERIQWACSRQFGVGADGLAVVEPGSQPGTVRLQYFNSDGRRASLCGNASLCAARLASWLELAPPEGFILETDAGPVPARSLPGKGELAEIAINGVSPIGMPEIEREGGEKWFRRVSVGVPHLVVLVEKGLADIDVARRGRVLRNHPSLLPDGANVNFVAATRDGWSYRTYERGVEAETLACGTGSVAVANALVDAKLAAFPVTLRTTSGCFLVIDRETTTGTAAFRLTGEGRLVFRAVLGGSA